MLENIELAAASGATYGAMRGVSNVLANAFRRRGYTRSFCDVVKETVYYATLYSKIFCQELSRANTLVPEAGTLNISVAAKRAAVETGQAMIVHAATYLFERGAREGAKLAKSQGWQRAGQGLEVAASVSRYGLFAYKAAREGVIPATVAMASGALTQHSVETFGARI